MNPQFYHSSSLGHYRLIRQLGHGGMGVVYLAEDTRLDRKVALKLLPSHLLSDEVRKRQFFNEARAAARLQHPNIVTIFDVGEINGQSYYSMQYVEGRTVRELIDVCRRSMDEAIRVFEGICEAVGHAHSHGLVHRDIKPANVIVTPSGSPMVLDFGLAVVMSDDSHQSGGEVLGTPNYMSPEQAQSRPIDHRSDIFSLGVMLYEMLTGVSPFVRGYIPATVQAIIHEPAKPMVAYVPNIPAGWQEIVDRALAKDRVYRYQSVSELQADMRRLKRGDRIPKLAGPPVELRPIRTDALAVLYLRNLGPADDEYLSYGLTEDLIVDLTRFARLRVTPMRTILQFRDSVLSPGLIARELGVGLVLDGSVHRNGDQVRVAVQLLDTVAEAVRWTERWEGSLSQIQQVRRTLTEGIAKAARSADASEKTITVSGNTTATDPIAYEYYLRGKYLYEHKQDRSDVETAFGLFQKALATDPDQLLAHAGLATIYIFRAEYGKAEAELTDALSRARHLGRPAVASRLATLLGRALALTSEYDRAIATLQEALELAVKSGDIEAEAEAGSTLLMVYKISGRTEAAPEVFERTMRLADRLGDEYKTVDALGHMGWIHMEAGETDRARSMFMTALPLARAREDRLKEAYLLNSIAATFFGTVSGFATKSELEYYLGAIKIWEQLKYDRAKGGSSNNLGLVYSRQGRFDEAHKAFSAAVESVRQSGERAYLSMFLGNLASTELSLGRCEAAERAAREALEIAKEINHRPHRSQAETVLGTILHAAGRHDEAEGLFREAIAHGDSATSAWQAALSRTALGELLVDTGQAAEARVVLQEVMTRVEKGGYEELAVRAVAQLALLGGLNGDPKAAEHLSDLAEMTEGLYLHYCCRRMQGHVMIHRAANDTERAQAVAFLTHALEEARRAGYQLEVERIQKLLG